MYVLLLLALPFAIEDVTAKNDKIVKIIKNVREDQNTRQEPKLKIKEINLHSLLRYLCTLGLPFIAAILTGLELGGKSLVDAEVIDMDSLPCLLDLFRPLPENDISDSVPKINATQNKTKNLKHMK